MWIMFSDCFLSIVSKDCQPDELVVRARRPGDIEQVFTGAKVRRDTKADYLYRTILSKKAVALAMAERIDAVNYPNFKDSVTDAACIGLYAGLVCYGGASAITAIQRHHETILRPILPLD
jgi:hypothetical protein